MKNSKKLLIALMFVFIIALANVHVSKAYDFTSNHITVVNDVKATKGKLHPVIILKNNTNKDLQVTYSFYIKNTDTNMFDSEILVKANKTAVLELPQLHHLGDTQESRTIWFNWSEPRVMKPLQNQIETSIFSNPKTPPPTELGLK